MHRRRSNVDIRWLYPNLVLSPTVAKWQDYHTHPPEFFTTEEDWHREKGGQCKDLYQMLRKSLCRHLDDESFSFKARVWHHVTTCTGAGVMLTYVDYTQIWFCLQRLQNGRTTIRTRQNSLYYWGGLTSGKEGAVQRSVPDVREILVPPFGSLCHIMHRRRSNVDTRWLYHTIPKSGSVSNGCKMTGILLLYIYLHVPFLTCTVALAVPQRAGRIVRIHHRSSSHLEWWIFLENDGDRVRG